MWRPLPDSGHPGHPRRDGKHLRHLDDDPEVHAVTAAAVIAPPASAHAARQQKILLLTRSMGPPSRKEGIVTGKAIHPQYARPESGCEFTRRPPSRRKINARRKKRSQN